MGHDVFVGSAINDEKVAEQITALLEKAELSCWRYEPDPGRQVSEARLAALDAGRTSVFIYSRSSNSSSQFHSEVQRARERGNKIIVLHLADRPVSPLLKALLTDATSIDATTRSPAEAGQMVLDAVRESIATTSSTYLGGTAQDGTIDPPPAAVNLNTSLNEPLPNDDEPLPNDIPAVVRQQGLPDPSARVSRSSRGSEYRWTGELTLWLIALGVPPFGLAILYTLVFISLGAGNSTIFGKFDATSVVWVVVKIEGWLDLVYFGMMFGWIHVSYRNARALGARDLHYPPIWAVAGFIVPLVSLYIPRRILQDIWQTSNPTLDADDAYGWKKMPISGLVNTWHSSLCIAVIGVIGINMSRTLDTKTFQAGPVFLGTLLVSILTVISFLAFLVLAVMISYRQEQRYARIAALNNQFAPRPHFRPLPIVFGFILTIATGIFTFSFSRSLRNGERFAWTTYDLQYGTKADFPDKAVQFPLNFPGWTGTEWISRAGGLTFIYDRFVTDDGTLCDNRASALESKLKIMADQQDMTLTSDVSTVFDGLPARTFTATSKDGAVRGVWFGSTSAIYATCAYGPASAADDLAFQHFLNSVQVSPGTAQPPGTVVPSSGTNAPSSRTNAPSSGTREDRRRRRPRPFYPVGESPSDATPGELHPMAIPR